MKPPRFLLGCALLLWGWSSGLWWLGIAAAAAIELPRWITARWEFAQADLDRVWNLCVTLFLGATLYAAFSSDSLNAVGELMRDDSPSARLATLTQSKRSLFQLLQWLPLMFLPIALAQVYGQQVQMDLSTFSWWLRRKRREAAKQRGHVPGPIHVGYPFFACCLFAASAGNPRTLWFSVAYVTLVAWALWVERARTFSGRAWAGSFFCVIGLGVALQGGLFELQKVLQRLDEALLARWSSGRNFDVAESQTRIGRIGKLKLSGRIVLRVEVEGQPVPALLRQASYDSFKAPSWLASVQKFEPVASEANPAAWILRDRPQKTNSVRIAGYLTRGQGLLSLPSGAVRFEHLPVGGLATNRFGAVRVEDGPGFVQFDTHYQADQAWAGSPGPEDRAIPPRELLALSEFARGLHLEDLSPADQIRTLETIFNEKFTYSTWQDERSQPNAQHTALGRFLLEHRSGHCEYFATATVLLLRHLGIPARYTTGFAVQEKKGRYYVVRERHAHAWCTAWVDGAWRDVDTTPATWDAIEARRAALWEPVRDLFSRLWFEFSKWRWGNAEWKRYLLWLIVPLLGFVLAKLLYEKQWSRARRPDAVDLLGPRPGLDSEFYEIESRLAAAGFQRAPGEAVGAWIDRLARNRLPGVDGLRPLLAFHYRLRFDPEGLSVTDRTEFRHLVRAWLEQASGPEGFSISSLQN